MNAVKLKRAGSHPLTFATLPRLGEGRNWAIDVLAE
jgi:hypothetical protein